MGGLLAGLEAILVALAFAVTLFVVAAIIRPFLLAVLGSAPLVGGWLASNVDAGLNRFQAALVAPANAALPVLVSSLTWTTDRGRELVNSAVRFAEGGLGALAHLSNEVLPREIAQARNFAGGLFFQALKEIQSTAHDLELRLLRIIQAGLESINQLIDQEVSRAREAENTLQQFASSEVQRVERNAAQAILQVAHDAQLLSQRAEAVAAQLVAGEKLLRETAQQVIARDLEAIEHQVTAQIPEAIGTVQRDVTALRQQTEAQIPELERNVNAEIQGILNSPQWLLLKSLTESGDQILKTGVQQLVGLTFKAARDQVANMSSFTKTQEANIEAIFDELKRDLAAK